MEKTIEYTDLLEFANSKDVNADNVVKIEMHFDKTNKKYITTITYGKKQ